ncbi:MAG: glutamine--fructose-6-phosphate transaminase (isomerizing) [Chlamydiia bacterium]
MCGIFALCGTIRKPSVDLCIEGLKKLEYRGYDSAGIAFIDNGKIEILKSCGKVALLEEKVDHLRAKKSISIAHTRWATHGGVKEVNAHPHIDEKGHLALVHNGIIENFYQIKEVLLEQGVLFTSQTDTEVVAQLFETLYNQNLVETCAKVLEKLEGTFALACIHKEHPESLLITTRAKPLIIAREPLTGQIVITSETNALYEGHFEIYPLQDDEIALIEDSKILLFSKSLQPIIPSFKPLHVQDIPHSKGEYPHYLLKEICEQPNAIRRTLEGRYDIENQKILLDLPPSFHNLIPKIERIFLIGCGTSYHVACIAAHFIEEMIQIPAQAYIASEFRYKELLTSPNTLVLAISQSGETADTIGAIREAKLTGAKILSITNTANSSIIRESDFFLMTQAGLEISVCSTKAFTSQLILLYLFTLFLTEQKKGVSSSSADWIQALRILPAHVENILRRKSEMQAIAKCASTYDKMIFIGRQYMYYTGLESSLKLKEISYLFSLCYPAGELKHGPLALIDEGTLTICLLGHRPTFQKTHSNLQEIQARLGPLFILSNLDQPCEEIEPLFSFQIDNPVPDALAPILYSIALQLFAYYVALEKGTDIDYPKNLAKSVTVE